MDVEFDSGNTPAVDVCAILRVVLDKLEEIIDAHDRADKKAEILRDRVTALLLEFHSKKPNATAYAYGSLGAQSSLAHEADRLVIKREPDGSALVLIDREPPVRLPRALADFLLHLVADGRFAEDGLSSWKSRESLLAWFRQRTDKEVKPHFVNQCVHKLRLLLGEAKIKRKLIHTHPYKGVRFALRRTVQVPQPRTQEIHRD